MENRQQHTLVAFENALIFIEQRRIEPEPPLLQRMTRSLRASMRRIREWSLDQKVIGIDRGPSVDFLRRKLRRERLMPLVQIARPLLAFAPGIAVLRVPDARADAKTVVLMALDEGAFARRHRSRPSSRGR
jgi:hypothetical protein